MRVLVLAAALFPLLSCASPPPVGDAPTPRVSARSCARQGGAIHRVGMSGGRACVIPYADAGRRCTDGSQCGGRCLLNLDDPRNDAWRSAPPGQAVGQCEASDMTFGCHATIDNGEVGDSICVD